ncbi:ribonuclease Z [Alteribacter populi]|uniref:ribonuclease Z n=1 Tax=Alteribacter populi TaxID=2011011 RepID=UPI000BBB4177|nr:ribonuclease Z [Alteribacter populi]
MKITFLGTGSGVPAKHRNVSSLALHLMNKKDAIWLFDCGEATQHQVLHTPVKLRKIEKIFITHTHGDHIYGLPGLLSSRSFQGAVTPLTIYGPKGLKKYIEISLNLSETYLSYPLEINEIDRDSIVFEDEQFIVKTSELIHGVPSFGFRVQQKDLPGPLLIDKVKEAGIPIGPMLQQLKKGLKVELSDGRTFEGSDFLGTPKKGKIVTIIGDTRYTEKAILLAKGANTLIHEATLARKDELLAKEYFHSTTVQAAEVADRGGVQQLILTHISTRYQEADELLYEAKEIFQNSFIAEDFSCFEVPS